LVFDCCCWLLLEDARSLLRAYSAVGARRPAAIQVRLSIRSWVVLEANDPLEASIGQFLGVNRQAGRQKCEPGLSLLYFNL
jgi:hypothetical protein